MNILFTKSRLKHHLIFGILWSAIGIPAVIYNSASIFSYGYLIIGVLYFATYLFEKNKYYLTIENGVISKNHLIPEKMNISDINQVKFHFGYYTLKTDSAVLKINTKLIEEESLVKLKELLDSLKVETK